MHWLRQRAFRCITPPSPTCYPGSTSRTKKSLVATERRRAKVKQRRADWFRHRLPAIAAMPDRVVFIDETAVKTNLTRLRGRAKRGERLTIDAPFGSWGTQTLIAGLTQDTLIAPWVIKGAMDGPAFAAYIREVLVPEIAPGTVATLDNLATHRNKEATQAFSKLKAHLRRIGARTFTEVFNAIGEICQLYEPTECWSYFKAARYVSGQCRNALGQCVKSSAAYLFMILPERNMISRHTHYIYVDI